MIIALVEDEPLVARRIERLTRGILGRKLTRLVVKASLPEAEQYVSEHSIDLLLLDLSLHGEDGFTLLRRAAAESFQTIVITAHEDRAAEAFEYGVLDFLVKPVAGERLAKALARFERLEDKNLFPSRYLAVRKDQKIKLIEVESVRYARGAGIYSELRMRDGSAEIHDKPLRGLNAILPAHFQRVHKSYLVNLRCAKALSAKAGGRHLLELDSGERIPVGRNRYRELKTLLSR